MALKAIYQRFLASPNPLSLSENASLHYIPTLTSFAQSGPIIRHLENQEQNVLRKVSEKVVHVIESQNALALETELTVEFVSGGGAYLPRLDNFISDHIATFPVTHIVSFDSENKIQQIRITWDQAGLLKQVNVIGASGRNWPISDGKDQARLIQSSIAAAPISTPAPAPESRGRTMQDNPATPRDMSPNKKYIKDPHASLDLFEKMKEEVRRQPQPNIAPPRESARPPPREMSELFAAGHEDYEPSQELGGSPRKVVSNVVIPTKGAGSQKFLPPRLFEERDDTTSAVGYKSDPSKYNHFDLGDIQEDDPLQHKKTALESTPHIPMRAKTNKHLSQWDFEDFVTPAKIQQKIREQDLRSYDWAEGDENGTTPEKKQPPPPPAAHRARRDAETHFELKQDETPRQQRDLGPPRGYTYKRGLGLYDNHLLGDETQTDEAEKKPLKPITNNAGRRKDFDGHWEMRDSSPAHMNNENKPIAADKLKAVKAMDAQWDTNDQSPLHKPAGASHLRKGLESHWGFGEGQDTSSTNFGKASQKSHWDF